MSARPLGDEDATSLLERLVRTPSPSGQEGRGGPAQPGLADPVPGGGGGRWEAQGDEREDEAHGLRKFWM